MNVYEHGIESRKDEWGGSLRLISSAGLPVYSGFSRALLDLNGGSLNERAVHLALVDGPHYASDYFAEMDVRYYVLASLYHVNRLIDLYVERTTLFDSIYPPGSAISGNIGDPRVYYEIDAFLASARRVYEAISKVLWKHCGEGTGGRWRSITSILAANTKIPKSFTHELRVSWTMFGNRLADYRDCMTHNDPLNDGQTTCRMKWYGKRWGMNVKLPANPDRKSRKNCDFVNGPDALDYCHQLACHLVDLCQALDRNQVYCVAV